MRGEIMTSEQENTQNLNPTNPLSASPGTDESTDLKVKFYINEDKNTSEICTDSPYKDEVHNSVSENTSETDKLDNPKSTSYNSEDEPPGALSQVPGCMDPASLSHFRDEMGKAVLRGLGFVPGGRPMDIVPPLDAGLMSYRKDGSQVLDRSKLVDYIGTMGIVSDGRDNLYMFDGCTYTRMDDNRMFSLIEDIMMALPDRQALTRNAKKDIVRNVGDRFRADMLAPLDDRYRGELIVFADTLYNLDTGAPLPFTPDLFVTHRLGAHYRPHASNQAAERVLKGIIPDEDTLLCFYALVGHTLYSEELAPPTINIVYGPGNTGKTALQMLITAAAGRANVSCLDLGQISEGFLTAELQDKVANICGETGSGRTGGMTRSDGELLKRLSDGQTVKVQRKYGQPFDMANTAKMWFVTNTLPDLGDSSSGLYRRVRIIPCRQEQRWEDRIYDVLLRPEAVDWFAMQCLRAYMAFNACGREFPVSAEMRGEAAAYKTQDPVFDFIADMCGTLDRDRVAARLDDVIVSELYDRYAGYIKVTGSVPLSQRRFGEKIRNEFGMEAGKLNVYRPDGSRTTTAVFRRAMRPAARKGRPPKEKVEYEGLEVD